MSCHAEPPTRTGTAQRFALVDSPHAGKTTLFNSLTGLRAKTGNYPGVTVARYEGIHNLDGGAHVTIEDLPGTYSLDPISPDEQVVAGVLESGASGDEQVDGLVVLLDSTNLRRSLGLLAQVQQLPHPVTAVLTFTDELARRGGSLDVEALSRAVGVRAIPVIAGDRRGVASLSEAMADVSSWKRPMVPPAHRQVGRGRLGHIGAQNRILPRPRFRQTDQPHRRRPPAPAV